MKFEIMRSLKSEFPIGRMADWFGVSRAGYYAHFKITPEADRAKADTLLGEKISAIHKDSRNTYGIDRIDQELRKVNIKCHHRRLSRLMKRLGIAGRPRAKKVRTTDSSHLCPISANLLQRNFSAKKPNLVWVSDITYIATREGWLYLCTVLDLYSRKIVGWSMSETLESGLAVDALRMAVVARKPAPGLLFHSDRGVQYASHDFRSELEAHRITQSMSRKGDCLDNACAESFFGTLKCELAATMFWNRAEAKREIFEYIEGFYNPRRSHSYLGYVSPDEFEQTQQVA